MFFFAVPLAIIVGIFLEDGQVCSYYNVDTHGRVYESGDIIELPRNNKVTTVVILGVHEELGRATALAQDYFKRLCKWDGVEHLSEVKIFGHELAPIEEEVSQIGFFATQGVDGPLQSAHNVFDMLDLKPMAEESEED